MRNALYICIAIVLNIMVLTAAEHKESFKVYGNCGMCKKTIEKAVKNINGVTDVHWSKKTKMIEITFDDAVTNMASIKKAIAEVGYDMDDVRASDENYDKLHTCCQYERPAKKQ